MRRFVATLATFAAASFVILPGANAAPSDEGLTKVVSTPKEILQADLNASRAANPELTEAQLLRQAQVAPVMDAIMNKFTTAYADSFGYAEYLSTRDVAEIHLVAAPTPDMRKFVGALKPSLQVNFVVDQKWTKEQAAEATNVAARAVFALDGVREGSGAYDIKSETVEIAFNVKEGYDLAQVEASAEETLATKSSLSRNASSALAASIPVTLLGDPEMSVDNYLISGGTALNPIPKRQDGLHICTGGFTARFNGTNTTGIMTARHCGVAYERIGYEGRDILSRAIAADRTLGDAQMWRSPEAASANFIYQRSGSTLYTRPLKAIAIPSYNQEVCSYGSTTKVQTCGRLRGYDRMSRDDSGNVYENLIGFTGSNLATYGDSGGPWFYNNTGYGLTQGGKDINGTFEFLMSPITDAVQSMNVTPLYG